MDGSQPRAITVSEPLTVIPHSLRPVVVGIDGSRRAMTAALWAAHEARRRGTSLHVVHATLWPLVHNPAPAIVHSVRIPMTRESRKLLAHTVDECRRVAPELDVTGFLETRPAVPALLEHAEQAQLLVAGNRGLGGFTGLLVGSVGIALAARAPCPVVVVRSRDDEPAPDTGPVVVGVDRGVHDAAAVEFAFEAAAARECPLVAVHGWYVPGYDDLLTLSGALIDWTSLAELLHEEITQELEPWKAKYPGVDVRIRVRYQQPAEALLLAAEDAQLVVVGTHGLGSLAGLILGPVSHALLHHAPCPVAVIRPDAADPAKGTAR